MFCQEYAALGISGQLGKGGGNSEPAGVLQAAGGGWVLHRARPGGSIELLLDSSKPEILVGKRVGKRVGMRVRRGTILRCKESNVHDYRSEQMANKL